MLDRVLNTPLRIPSFVKITLQKIPKNLEVCKICNFEYVKNGSGPVTLVCKNM